jgi:hypothetical protein
MKFFHIGTMSACALALAFSANADCRDGVGAVQWRTAVGGNGHWYKVVTDKASWNAARENALLKGAHLVTPTSAAENAFVYSLAKATIENAGLPGVWMGARAAQGQCSNPNGFFWVTNEPWSYTNWFGGRPNYADECAAAYRFGYNGQWNNLNGNTSTAAVYEWSADCNDDGEVDYGQIVAGDLIDLDCDFIPDCCEKAGGDCNCQLGDCNSNSLCDDIEIDFPGNDCNDNNQLDVCEIANGAADCNNNGVIDSCEIAAGAGDCDNDGVLDSCEIAAGAADCNNNGKPDSCELANGTQFDCNGNGRLDSCDIASGYSKDCNNNGKPDECDIQTGAALDCNNNGKPDSCDIASGVSRDVNYNGIPDECEPDCNGNGVPDAWEISQGLTPDCNGNGKPDSCDIASGAVDCNSNGVPDSCEMVDCNGNGKLDSCDIATGYSADCNANGIPDSCDLANGTRDCNGNGKPDSCDIAAGTSGDCNTNTVPDECDVANGAPDCNDNMRPDSCDIADGTDPDPEGDGIPNSCEVPSAIRMSGPVEQGVSSCIGPGADIYFDVFVDNPMITLVAGQFNVVYDRTVLDFTGIEAGDAPFTSIPLSMPNETAGTIFWVSSVPSGGNGTLADSRVARLKFRALADDCTGDVQIRFDPASRPILIANGGGTGDGTMPLINPASVPIDGAAPVITNVPADYTTNADAGAGCMAMYTIPGQPTVTDGCSSAELSWTRSDGQLLTAPWPCGTTTVTWKAVDPCGNESTATTKVTVLSSNRLDITVVYAGSGYAAEMTRCIDFVVGGHQFSELMTFFNGVAMKSVDIPVASYNCGTVDDNLHSLVSQADVRIFGRNYQLVAAGDSALRNGDVNDDNTINVVDWGVVVVRIGELASVNTDCSTQPFHADFDGTGSVTDTDGDFVLDQFLANGAFACGSAPINAAPVMSITVAELSAIAGADASIADRNGDGKVDRRDIEMWKAAKAKKPIAAKAERRK